MRRVEAYRQELRNLASWDDYLLAESRLPGPRANLELAEAAADVGDEGCFRHLLDFDSTVAPANSPTEFLPVCGAIGLGKLLANGQREVLADLRRLAIDPRWRVREAVAIALQRWGDVDMPALLAEMASWAASDPLTQRAAVAALCEPRLLALPEHAQRVLAILDAITTSLLAATERRGEPRRVLRQALAYGWSVAVVALPHEGKPLLEKYGASPDPDVRWLVRENLKKNRLLRLDSAWVSALEAQMRGVG